jgi:DNA repair exonuclease SbcCD ATPase subunit
MAKQLTKIFHISDIHIRHGDQRQSRYLEYDTVFDNLYASLKQQIELFHLSQDEFIIIITGDVFHNKNVIGNYGLTLYKKFIQLLTSIGRTIIFHGNHDRNQNEIDQPSLISSTLDIPNLTILQDTQTFTIDNIGFSYLSIDDTLDITTTSGRVNNLPSFPSISEPVKHKIALFHGTFASVKLYNGTDVTDTQNPYPFSLLQNFDFALLGDIHLRQKGLYQSTLWGYSGSLIQQNYGEDLINHGYLIWDLPSKSITEVNVYNPYGMVNIKTVNDTICIRKRGQYEPLAQQITSEYFPRHIDVKLYSDVDLPALFELLTAHNITCNIVNKLIQDGQPDNTTNNSSTDASLDIDTQIDKETLIQHFSNHLTPQQNTILSNIIRSYDNLLFDVAKYPDDLQDKCLKLNKELSTLITNCQNTQSTADVRPQFTIKYLEWSNLFCYEGTQWIDFEKAEYSTFLVTGKNGTGKSAIYDILTLAIWGDIPKSKQQKELFTGILNYKHNCANTVIDVECNSIKYRITRSFNLQTKDGKTNLNNAHTVIQKYLQDNEIELYKSDNAAKLEITKLLGTMEEFLTSSMITQNMDLDILKMDYKDVLSLVDQRFDISYIYNLYELFKSSTKKYQDFKKIIEAKTEVYAKLLSTSSLSDDTATSKLEEELQLLETNRQTMLTEFNAILVDINDPTNKMITSTDYDLLISKLPITAIKSDDDYKQAQGTLIELKAILKGLSQNKIEQLLSQYTTVLELSPIPKPCEYSLIESEEDALKPFTDVNLLPEFKERSITELHKLQETLHNDNCNLTQQLKHHNNIKPITVQKPNYTEEEILSKITNKYNSLDNFLNFCKTNTRQPLTSHKQQNEILYTQYTSTLTDLTNLQKIVPTIKENIIKIDTDFKTLHLQKSNLTPVNKPEQSVHLKTSASIKKYLNTINISQLQSSIQQDNSIMEAFYKSLDIIADHTKELKAYQTELDTLTSNSEYSYNPNCEHCCKRPWVQRIRQLQDLITDKTNIITSLNISLYDTTENDYLEVYTRLESNKQAVQDHQLYTTWHSYYKYKEQDDHFTKDINKLLASKEELNTGLKNTETNIQSLNQTITTFNSASFELLDKYNTIQSYNAYTTWKTTYDEFQTKQITTQTRLKNVSEYLAYTNNIKPRIHKLADLKDSYAKWQTYDKNTKISTAYKATTLQQDIGTYSKIQEYTRLKSLQPLIIRKTELNLSLSKIDERIKALRNDHTQQNTIAAYNNSNLSKHTVLTESLTFIQDTIDLMTVVTEKFLDYRKELYSTKILPKLTAATNKYINTLCHNTTKEFELDYLVSIYRDKDIHINWLIKNVTEDDKNQTISVKQASGFQQFAISFAMRMSLFSNKTCNQLFIDEGFTACDKDNLSIVPSFLRALLKTFKSIVIVSHIDLIQDSVDNVAHINFDKCRKSSSIHYGDQILVAQRRRKLSK